VIERSDESDFNAFVAASSTRLLRTAYLMTGDHGHAEDIVQTALLRTARRWRKARTNPQAYARAIVANLAKDRWRHLSRRPGEHQLETDIASALEDSDHEALLAATRQLAHGQRAVLVLRYFDDLTVEETAQALGCTTGTVKSQTHRALENLRHALAIQNEEFTNAD
jgi:RNA polymerase sigma-70 factor (sigma-E family)